MTILSAINPLSLKITTVTTDKTCTMELMEELLDSIAQEYAKQITAKIPIVTILDNARYQRANRVQEYAKKL
jgi:hypothetical protein